MAAGKAWGRARQGSCPGTTARRLALGATAGVAIAALAACSPVIRHHGHVPDEYELALIEVGADRRDDVAEKIGFPGATGLVTEDVWYYVQSRRLHGGPGDVPEVERTLVAVSFDAAGRVSGVESFGLEDGQIVQLSRRVTQSNVPEPNILSQLLRNIGIFQPSQFFD